MFDAYHAALAIFLAAALCWLAALVRIWIRMRDELRRERDLFRDAHVTTCRQLREAIEDGQAARAELAKLGCVAERLAISQREELAQRREVERLRAVLRGIGTAAEAAAGNEPAIPANEPAHSVSFPAHSGSFSRWVVPEDQLPDAPIARSGDPRAIAGQSSGQSGWIRVADALPDYRDEEVVALAGGCPMLAVYSSAGVWRDGYGTELAGVTHWARWPEGSGVAGGAVGVQGVYHGVHGDSECVGDGPELPGSGPLPAVDPLAGCDAVDAQGLRELGDGQPRAGEQAFHGGHVRDGRPDLGSSQLSDSSR